MTKPVWSHVLILRAWTLSKAFIISYQKTSQPHQPTFTFQTIPDSTRYIIGAFCCNLNHRQTFLLHINTLVPVKAEI